MTKEIGQLELIFKLSPVTPLMLNNTEIKSQYMVIQINKVLILKHANNL